MTNVELIMVNDHIFTLCLFIFQVLVWCVKQQQSCNRENLMISMKLKMTVNIGH